jgi:putative endonuclease
MSFRTERSGERNLKNLAKSQDRSYYVYILTNSVRTLYVGVTSDLFRRIHEHRQRLVPGFTRKYNLTWLAYYEETSDVESAIGREKQIKKWRRSKKIALIESANPRWQDMALDWYREAAH